MATKTIQTQRGLGIRSRRRLSSAFTTFLLAFFALFVLVPFAFQISTSLKSEEQLFVYPIEWIPNPVLCSITCDIRCSIGASL